MNTRGLETIQEKLNELKRSAYTLHVPKTDGVHYKTPNTILSTVPDMICVWQTVILFLFLTHILLKSYASICTYKVFKFREQKSWNFRPFSSFVRKCQAKFSNKGFESPHQLDCTENMPYSRGNILILKQQNQ